MSLSNCLEPKHAPQHTYVDAFNSIYHAYFKGAVSLSYTPYFKHYQGTHTKKIRLVDYDQSIFKN
jgi:hypothetical protein